MSHLLYVHVCGHRTSECTHANNRHTTKQQGVQERETFTITSYSFSLVSAVRYEMRLASRKVAL